MPEPLVFGIPITTFFLYFMFYSFAGWVMETIYCSLAEKRFVVRGFLLGPICPIYGVGALIIILLFERFSRNPLLFYPLATLAMAAWEYAVGWFLETATHIKYWDYSRHKFNLHGRVSLFICLWWGLLAYAATAYVHPEVGRLFAAIPPWLSYAIAGSAVTLLTVDTITTVRKLALTAKVMLKLEEVSGELRMQLALGRAELGGRLDSAVEGLTPELRARLGAAKGSVSRGLDGATENLRARRSELIAQAERYSRRFLKRYSALTSKRFILALSDVKEASQRLKSALANKRKERDADRTSQK